MEDFLPLGLPWHSGRILASKQGSLNAVPSSWKNALWEKNSIEPAMLRVPIVVVIFIFLWGINVWTMEKFRLQYYNVLAIKAAPTTFVFLTAIFLGAMYVCDMTLISSGLGWSVEMGVFSFYCLLFLSLLVPILPGQESRSSFFRLLRLVFFPGTSISFPEVLLADALTSLSKILKDLGVTIISVYSHISTTHIIDLHDNGMMLVAVLASIPYWLRIRQCWVQFDGCSDTIGRIPILLNIVKYFTAFPPIWLAAAASLGYFHPSLPAITAALATVNSVYSYTWDVVMDWGMITFWRSGTVTFRKRAMYPWFVYVLALALNLVLRFAWAANRVPSLSRMHPSHLVLLVELGEVFRRFVWNFFRIEWEMLVQQDRLSTRDGDDEEASDKKLIKIPKQISISSTQALGSPS